MIVLILSIDESEHRSQWFVREIAVSKNNVALINKYINVQFFLGVVFYVFNVVAAGLIYEDQIIVSLTVVLGLNIIFDNVINTIKNLNIAEFKQKKTFVILTLEAFLKFVAASLLFIFPFSVMILSIVIVLVRFFTLNLFLKFGSSNSISVKALFIHKISFFEIRNLVLSNWPFLVIGSLSIINWRISNVIISKVLTVADVADYEVSYKVFSMFQLLPVIITATLFPSIVNLYKGGDSMRFQQFYRKVSLFYALFGLISYTFIFSFADVILPLVFGEKYGLTAVYTKQMFLTILVFPTVFLQASFLTAMKLEKTDMWLNLIALITNVAVCLIGFQFTKSLLVVNISVFVSFVFFHFLQDVVLIRRKVIFLMDVFGFYIIGAAVIFSYISLSKFFNSYFFFACYWIVTLIFFLGKDRLLKSCRLCNN